MSEKITITFPDGNKKEVDKGINGLELASQISKSLAKESVGTDGILPLLPVPQTCWQGAQQ